MKKNIQIFFITFLLCGYACQTGRFITALHEYAATHKTNNRLSKKVTTFLSHRTGNEKKISYAVKFFGEKDAVALSRSIDFSFFTRVSKGHCPAGKTSTVATALLHCCGKRGPPSLV